MGIAPIPETANAMIPDVDALAALEDKIREIRKRGGDRSELGCDSLLDLHRAVRVVRKWAESQATYPTKSQ